MFSLKLKRRLIISIMLALASFSAIADDNSRPSQQDSGAGAEESVMMADPTAVEGVEQGDIHPDSDQDVRNNNGGGRRR